ncbi:MAG: hypoxanthine phosphoribosyltransferase [Planctomycetes bacterium]|nr:hypoxanthine phosphoribosyltransferase [Planctomycetota bacterium]
MVADVESILIDRAQIALRVHDLGRELARDLQDELQREGHAGDDGSGRIVFVPILTGALVFTADLIRELTLKLSLRVVAVSSYPGTSIESKGAKLAGELPKDLSGKHVVIVDDILDSGQTLGLIDELIRTQKPASIRICVLLKKPPEVRRREVKAHYVGFDIPNEFVVGYGLDYDGYYRNLPYVGVLKKEAIGR